MKASFPSRPIIRSTNLKDKDSSIQGTLKNPTLSRLPHSIEPEERQVDFSREVSPWRLSKEKPKHSPTDDSSCLTSAVEAENTPVADDSSLTLPIPPSEQEDESQLGLTGFSRHFHNTNPNAEFSVSAPSECVHFMARPKEHPSVLPTHSRTYRPNNISQEYSYNKSTSLPGEFDFSWLEPGNPTNVSLMSMNADLGNEDIELTHDGLHEEYPDYVLGDAYPVASHYIPYC